MNKRIVTALLLIVALLLSGCAAVKTLLPVLAEYGIAKAEELAKGGREAINKARERALAIPDQVDQMQALLEVMRAEQIYQTQILEWLQGDELQDGDPPSEPAE